MASMAAASDGRVALQRLRDDGSGRRGWPRPSERRRAARRAKKVAPSFSSQAARARLPAVAGVMFLVLDRQLKDHHLKSGLFRNLPPVRELLKSTVRLLWLGVALLSIGVFAGFMMPRQGGTAHLIAACAVWLSYVGFLAIKQLRGLTGRRTATVAVLLFLVSLSVFALV